MKKKYLLAAGITSLVALSPVIASAATANTTINATVAAVITVSTSGTVTIAITPTSGGVVSSNSDTVTVSTNDTLGYTLTFSDSDTTSNLVSGANTFTPGLGSLATPVVLQNGKWGYCVAALSGCDATYSAETNNASSTSKWAAVPISSSPATIKTTSTTASGDTTAVWFGAKANSAQPNGTYTDTVTYTATTN